MVTITSEMTVKKIFFFCAFSLSGKLGLLWSSWLLLLLLLLWCGTAHPDFFIPTTVLFTWRHAELLPFHHCCNVKKADKHTLLTAGKSMPTLKWFLTKCPKHTCSLHISNCTGNHSHLKKTYMISDYKQKFFLMQPLKHNSEHIVIIHH